MTDPWALQKTALGAFIRSQRELAHLSLRQLAELTSVSHPYLSQVERGVHQPSVRVLRLLAEALDVSAETLLVQAGLLGGETSEQPADGEDRPAGSPDRVTAAIQAHQRLTAAQKAALIAVYQSMLGSGQP